MVTSASPLRFVRTQVATVRTLVDEIERLARTGEDAPLDAQLIDELQQLGRATLDAAAELLRRRT
jgi:hypothetical protein